MRILIFTEVLAPYVSGISSYVEVLRKGLEELSHQVLIVTSSPHIKEASYKNGVIRCPAKFVNNKYGYECKNYNDPKIISFISSFDPDVVHIHTDTKIGYMGLIVADKTNSPVVFTIHDYFMDRFAADSSKLLWNVKTYFEKQHFRDMLDNADVVTSSCSRAAIFVQKAERRKKVFLIRSNTDTDQFDYNNSTKVSIRKMRQKLGLSENATVAVFAGNLTVEKNLEFVLSAFAAHLKKSDNIQLLIVGDGTETDYLKSLCAKLKIKDMVVFAGAVANSIMPDIYSACDIYVCSADDSLVSMSFLEAMGCGLPVLVKEDKEKIVNKMIKHGTNGFVFSKKAEFIKYLKTLSMLSESDRRRIRQIVRDSLVTADHSTMAELSQRKNICTDDSDDPDKAIAVRQDKFGAAIIFPDCCK